MTMIEPKEGSTHQSIIFVPYVNDYVGCAEREERDDSDVGNPLEYFLALVTMNRNEDHECGSKET